MKVQQRILLVTDNRFWYESQGSQRRIAALCRALRSHGFHLEIFFNGRLLPTSQALLNTHWKGLKVHTLPPNPLPAHRTPPCASRKISTVRHKGQRLVDKIGAVIKLFSPRLYDITRDIYRAIVRPLRKKSIPALPPLTVPAPPKERTLAEMTSSWSFECFSKFCQRNRYDAVIVEYIRLAYLMEALPETARPMTLLDTHDIMHLRQQRFHDHGERHWLEISQEEESEVFRRFDRVIAIQKREAALLCEMAGPERVLTAMHPVRICEHPFLDKRPYTLLYVSANDPSHIHAIDWFFAGVWPHLRALFGANVSLRITGSICNALQGNPPEGVTLAGFVDCLDEEYAQADVVINPVQFGGGLKIKCVEAMAHGKALMTTPIGAEGLEDVAHEALLIEATEEGWTRALAELLKAPGKRQVLGAKALEYARAHFTEAAAFGELFEALRGAEK